MVKLGFVKDAEQCPPDFHRVFVRSALLGGPATTPAGEVITTVRSWPDREGEQRFELAVDVPPGVEAVAHWAPSLARILTAMGWTQWWLDSFSLSQVLDRYITEALRLWGVAFWQDYKLDGIVLIQVGLQREAVSQSVKAWHQKYPEVRFSSAHDYEAMEREQAQQVKTRSEKFKALLKPKFFSTKKAT